MKSILEKALVHLLNEETDKANELMHQFVVERARAIHESLREGDEDNMDMSLDEEFFSESDLVDTEVADQMENDLDDDDVSADVAVDDEFAGDDAVAPVDGVIDAEVVDDDAAIATDDADISTKIDNIEDEIQALQAEFDKIMAEFDDGSEVDGDIDTTDEVAPEMTDDTEMGSDDEFDDITESMVDDLKKITTPNTDGMGATGSKQVTMATKSPIAKDAKNTVLASKDRVAHTGFELETAPAKKDGPDRGRKYSNNRAKAVDGNAPVAPTGAKGAALNKPAGGAATKSVIPGKKI